MPVINYENRKAVSIKYVSKMLAYDIILYLIREKIQVQKDWEITQPHELPPSNFEFSILCTIGTEINVNKIGKGIDEVIKKHLKKYNDSKIDYEVNVVFNDRKMKNLQINIELSDENCKNIYFTDSKNKEVKDMSQIKDANPQAWLEKEAKSVGLIPLEGGGQTNGDFWIWCADVRFKENRSRFDYLKNKFSQTFSDYEIKGIVPDREKPGEKVRRELLTKYNTESAPCYTIVVVKKSIKDSFDLETTLKLSNSAIAHIKGKYTECIPGRENGNTCTLNIKLKKEYRSSSEELAKKVVSSIKKSLPKFEDFKYKLTNEGFVVSFTDTNAYAKDSKKAKDIKVKDSLLTDLKTQLEKLSEVEKVYDIESRLNVPGKVGRLRENIYHFNVKIKNDVPLTNDLNKKCKSVILYCCKSHGIIEGYSKECNALLMHDNPNNAHAFGFILYHYLPIKDSKTKDAPIGYPIEEKTSHIVYHDRERLDQLEKKLNGYFNINIVTGCELTASTIKLIREDYNADLKQVKSDPKLIEKESDVRNHYLKYQNIINKVIQHYASAYPSSDVWRQVSAQAHGNWRIVDAKVKDSFASDIYSKLKQQCSGLITNIKVSTNKKNGYGDTYLYCSLNFSIPNNKVEFYADRITTIINDNLKNPNHQNWLNILLRTRAGGFYTATSNGKIYRNQVTDLLTKALGSNGLLEIVCSESQRRTDSIKDSIIQDIKSRPSVLDIKTKTQDSNDGNTTLTVRTYIRANAVDEIRWNEWSEDYLNRKSSSERVVFCDSIPVDHNKTVKVNGEDCWVSDVKITYKKEKVHDSELSECIKAIKKKPWVIRVYDLRTNGNNATFKIDVKCQNAETRRRIISDLEDEGVNAQVDDISRDTTIHHDIVYKRINGVPQITLACKF